MSAGCAPNSAWNDESAGSKSGQPQTDRSRSRGWQDPVSVLPVATAFAGTRTFTCSRPATDRRLLLRKAPQPVSMKAGAGKNVAQDLAVLNPCRRLAPSGRVESPGTPPEHPPRTCRLQQRRTMAPLWLAETYSSGAATPQNARAGQQGRKFPLLRNPPGTISAGPLAREPRLRRPGWPHSLPHPG